MVEQKPLCSEWLTFPTSHFLALVFICQNVACKFSPFEPSAQRVLKEEHF